MTIRTRHSGGNCPRDCENGSECSVHGRRTCDLGHSWHYLREGATTTEKCETQATIWNMSCSI